MSETKFTKGPWEPDRIAVRSAGPTGRHIALCEISVRGRTYDETYDEALANAHLIAAAPDLYEALNACLGLLTGNMDGDLPDERDPKEMALAALSKARGESPASKGEGE